ncbi:MAG: amidohydrolase family protein [Methanothrix sp.]
MNDASLEIRGVSALLNNQVAKRVNIFIENGKISEINKKVHEADRIIDLHDRNIIAIPGLINTHTHIAMGPLRGAVDAVNLGRFLELTGEYDKENDKRTIYDSTVIGIAEMIKNGITDFVDFYYGEDIVASAVEAMHYQGHLGWAVLDKDKTTQKGDPLSNAERFLKTGKSSRVTPMVAVQGVYAASKDTISSAYDIAEKHSAELTMHIAETDYEVVEHKKRFGKRPVEWMHANGLVRKNLLAVHCVWLNSKEISIISKMAGAVSYNPTSNMKLGSGIAPIYNLVKDNALVTLGTDSTASNNSLDILAEMKYGAILQSAKYLNPEAITPEQAFAFATYNASSFLHGKPNTLSTGSKADITLVETNLMPMEKALNNIVYATNPSNVFGTVVAGEVLYINGKLQARLEDELVKAKKSIARIKHKL